MLCGYLKQTCKSITVKELIEILQLCKNQDAVVKMSGMTNYYIHFDQDGQFIDFAKSPYTNDYGECGKENTCATCARHDHVKNVCKCDGKNCINADTMVDTEIFNNRRILKEANQENTKSRASKEQVSESKYDLSNYSINGMAVEEPEQIKAPKVVIPAKEIQKSVDDAIINALSRMINGIKGE